MTDLEHYRRYLGGDESGLSELMHRYGDALTVYIDGYLGDIQESEDLMIEAFSYLCLKKPRIREGSLKRCMSVWSGCTANTGRPCTSHTLRASAMPRPPGLWVKA